MWKSHMSHYTFHSIYCTSFPYACKCTRLETQARQTNLNFGEQSGDFVNFYILDLLIFNFLKDATEHDVISQPLLCPNN